MNNNIPERVICQRIHFGNHNWFGFKNPETNKWWKCDYRLPRTEPGRTRYVIIGGWRKNPANIMLQSPEEM
jgi:hypothetical protein